MQAEIDARIKATGAQNAYFPLDADQQALYDEALRFRETRTVDVMSLGEAVEAGYVARSY